MNFLIGLDLHHRYCNGLRKLVLGINKLTFAGLSQNLPRRISFFFKKGFGKHGLVWPVFAKTIGESGKYSLNRLANVGKSGKSQHSLFSTILYSLNLLNLPNLPNHKKPLFCTLSNPLCAFLPFNNRDFAVEQFFLCRWILSRFP